MLLVSVAQLYQLVLFGGSRTLFLVNGVKNGVDFIGIQFPVVHKGSGKIFNNSRNSTNASHHHCLP